MGVVQSDKIRGVASCRCSLVGKVIQYYGFCLSKVQIVISIGNFYESLKYSKWPPQDIGSVNLGDSPIDHHTELCNPMSTSIKLSKAVR